MGSLWKKVLFVLFLAVFAFLIWEYCFHPKPIPIAGDCPQGDFTIVTSDTQVTSIPVAEPIDKLPEYHDCQRLLVDKSATGKARDFGPLVAVWAAYQLDKFFVVGQINPTFPGSGVSPGGSVTTRPYEVGDAVAVAEVLNFDKEEYRPLHIKPGFSCLYLRQTSGGWQAFLVWLDQYPTPCKGTSSSATSGQQLLVRTEPLAAGLTSADIPPVARWDWDEPGQGHFIGLRCGNEWCDVGNNSPPFRFSPARASSMAIPTVGTFTAAVSGSPTATSNENTRVLAVKGWYDEQQLAVRGDNGKLGPTQTAIAWPHPLLDRMTDMGTEKWSPVAYVQLETPYAGKLPLDAGVSEISFCKGNKDFCGITDADQPESCTVDTQADTDPWWARIVSSTSTRYRCVKRRTHLNVIPAGAVRWRWSDTDETLWVRCPGGCCQVN